MEYDDAPSGYVKLYNYKEPLMKYQKGDGFLGVLLYDGSSDKIQCHLCGGWFHNLSAHSRKEHAMSADEYKYEVGLLRSTALISEEIRKNYIKGNDGRTIKSYAWLKHQTPEARAKRAKTIGKMLKENRFENMNKHGTCPEQLIDRLIKLKEKLGRTPKRREVGFIKALLMIYGSYENACRIANVEYRKKGFSLNNLSQGHRKGMRKWTNQDLLDRMRDFKKVHGREPSCSDFTRGLISGYGTYCAYFGSYRNAKKEAFQ